AVLTTTYITNTTILVSVPSLVPLDITNQMRIVFANGSTLEHEFEVQISEPFVNSINNEYALVREVATIRCNYFYEPLTLTFTVGRAHVSTLVWRNPIMPSAAKTKSIK